MKASALTASSSCKSKQPRKILVIVEAFKNYEENNKKTTNGCIVLEPKEPASALNKILQYKRHAHGTKLSIYNNLNSKIQFKISSVLTAGLVMQQLVI